MWYKCTECGHLFESGEWGRISESGEFWGSPFSYDVKCCPLCEGDFEEAVQCEICDSYHLPDELNNGICPECIEEFSVDIDLCYKVAKADERDIKINGFLATMFERDAIEEILLKHLHEIKNHEKVDCSEYINGDVDWFIEEVKKNEC